MKYLKSFNESIKDLMKPKSDEEIQKVWDKYWSMKQLLHNTYPANAYAVRQFGGLSVDWGEVGKGVGFDNLPQVKKDIIKLMDDNGFRMINHISSMGEFKIRT